MTSPPSASPRHYFLKTQPLPGASPSPFSSGLYVRHCGTIRLGSTAASTFHTLVLTPGPPVYLKGEEENGTSRVVYAYQGRKWGMVMNPTGGLLAGWQAVEMREGEGDEGFTFETGEGAVERLKWTPTGLAETVEWKGWMVCDWVHGHPQLFWVTSQLKGELPAWCERVDLVREYQDSS